VIEGNYFLKSLPLNNPEKRAMIEKYGLFWKEIQIYKHLFICFNGNNNGKGIKLKNTNQK